MHSLRAELERLQLRAQNYNPFIRIQDNDWEQERRDLIDQIDSLEDKLSQEQINRENSINSLNNQLEEYRNIIGQLGNEAQPRNSDDTINSLINQLEEYRNRIRQLENEAQSRNNQLAICKNRIKQLENLVQARNCDNTITSLNNQLTIRRNRIRQLENEARNRDDTINSLNNQLTICKNRIKQLENEAQTRDNDDTINSLNNQLAICKNRIIQLENEAQTRNRDISELRNIQVLLQGIRMPQVIQVPITTNKDKKVFYKFKSIIENQANKPNNFGVKEDLLREMVATIQSLLTKKTSPNADEVDNFIQRMTDVLSKLERIINFN